MSSTIKTMNITIGLSEPNKEKAPASSDSDNEVGLPLPASFGEAKPPENIGLEREVLGFHEQEKANDEFTQRLIDQDLLKVISSPSHDASPSTSNSSQKEHTVSLAQRVDHQSQILLNDFAKKYVANNSSITPKEIKDLENAIHRHIVQTHSAELSQYQNPKVYIEATKINYLQYLEEECKNFALHYENKFNPKDFNTKVSTPFLAWRDSLRDQKSLEECAELAKQIRKDIYKNAFHNTTLQGTTYVDPNTGKAYRVSSTSNDILNILDVNIKKCTTTQGYFQVFRTIYAKCQKKISQEERQNNSTNKTLFEHKEHSDAYKSIQDTIDQCKPYCAHLKEEIGSEASSSNSFQSGR